MTALSIVELERLATDATTRGLDVVTVLAEVVEITDHGDGWIVAGDVHLSLGITGWHATLSDHLLSTGSALIGARR